MKLTAFLISTVFVTVSANGVSQSISFTGKNVSLETIFSAVEKQTGFVAFYDYRLIANSKPVSINVNNEPLCSFLSLCLSGQNLCYNISSKSIIISRYVAASSDRRSLVSSIDTTSPKTHDITGKVTNENGEPLVGATVTIKGTKIGTSTNGNGEFTITASEKDEILVFTGSNIDKYELELNGRTDLSVRLTTKVSTLDEAVVIPYGVTTGRLNVGNITKIRAIDIQNSPVSNPLLALEGRVPGLFITQTNGLPGGGVTTRIQGANSIGKGNDPLFVIDGVPYASQMLSTTNAISPLGTSGGPSGSGNGNPLSFINPADIESVEILKDADATSIYGSRASNGAILITTKKGKPGQTKMDFILQGGLGGVARKIGMLNTSQYLQMRKEAFKNDNSAIGAADYDLNGLWDTTRYTDWQKTLLGGTAKYLTSNFSISGGNENTQYLIGGTYRRETTVFPGDFSDQKGSVHFSMNNTSTNQRFRIQLSGNYMYDNNQLSQTDLTAYIQLAPDAPALYTTDGSLNWMPNNSSSSSWSNPLKALYNKYQNVTTNLISSSNISYKILPGLEARANLGYNRLQTNELSISPLIAKAPETRSTSSRTAQYTNSSISSWIFEPQLNFKKSILSGQLELLAGMTVLETTSLGNNLFGSGYNSDLVLSDIKSAASITVNGSVNSVYKYNAFFSRANYTLKNKYILNLSARRDGSSRFGIENQFHDFGSIGGGWIISEEEFFKNSFRFVSFTKLKASFGTTGNNQIGDYQYLNLFSPITAGTAYQNITSLAPNGLPNQYLKWEETKKMEIGIELGLFQNRVLFNAIYAKNKSSNQLLSYALPIITGFSNIIQNFPATIQNTSLEFSLNTNIIRSSKFKWNSYINLTIPNNKLVSFPNISTSSYASSLIIGQPISIVKAYPFLGVDPATGIYKLADIHGNPSVTPSSSTDRIFPINTLPEYYGGLQNTFFYGGLQLDILFQFVRQIGANYRFNNVPGQLNATLSNEPLWVLNRWQHPGDISLSERFSQNSSLTSQALNTRLFSTYGYSDASYARLKNISLSWQIPERFMHSIHVKQCRIYVEGQNLITITNFQGVDPENKSITSLPPLKLFVFGVQAGL